METINEQYLRPRLLLRANDSHKGDYGHLLVVAGCQTMPGAAVLAAGAALHSGCGLVTLHSTERALQAVVNSFPSAILSEDPGCCLSRIPDSQGKYSAIAVGPGLGQRPETLAALKELLSTAKSLHKPMILDADALNLIADHPDLWESVPEGSVLTPHLGELRRLLSCETDEEKDAAVRRLCRETGCTLVMKGYHTRVYTPDGYILENTTGNPGLAKGGSGDDVIPRSLKDDEGISDFTDFCTETLAQIYADQGYPEQARQIYSRLSLRFPEKSAYFAALIEKLKK